MGKTPHGAAEAPARPLTGSRLAALLDLHGDRLSMIRVVDFPGRPGKKVGLRPLSDSEAAEAHRRARAWCVESGFNPDAAPSTNSGAEFSLALSAEALLIGLVDPKTGFPLCDTVDDLRKDLRREQIRAAYALLYDYQLDIAPPPTGLTEETFKEVVEAAKKGQKERPWLHWPRSMLVDLCDTWAVAARAGTITGSTSSSSTSS